MKFNKWLDNKKYQKILRQGHAVIQNKYGSFNLNQEEKEDIISEALEKLLIENPDIIESTAFTYICQWIKYRAYAYINGNYKKKVDLSETINIDKEDEVYTEVNNKTVNFDLLDSDTKNILKDKFENGMEFNQIKEKYKIKSMNTVYRRARKQINGERVYKGIARLLDGKLDKCYPDITSVASDGFNRTTISKCVSGKLKTFNHGGYEWRFVSELKQKSEE